MLALAHTGTQHFINTTTVLCDATVDPNLNRGFYALLMQIKFTISTSFHLSSTKETFHFNKLVSFPV